jgi:hypothetical protein
LIEFGCRRERCAWWDQSGARCAVITIMPLLQNKQTNLPPLPPDDRGTGKQPKDSG